MTETTYQLNKGQEAALSWLVKFCLGQQENRMVLLSGHAGTGKTFTVNRVVEEVRKINPDKNFGMTAPTHKAVKVLKKQSDLRDLLDFGTIHSFLSLKQVIDDKGKVEYKPEFNKGRRRRIDGIHVLILDESSMLDDALMDHLLTEINSGSLRIIFMGDERQIPPVGKKQKTGESNAIPFLTHRQSLHKIHVLILDEPQRQAKGSEIIKYATAIRDQHLRQKIDFMFPDSREEIEVLPANLETLREIFRRYFCTPEFKADADYVKLIAWTNKVVDYFNREIRLLIYNAKTLPRLVDMEFLIMDAPLIDRDGKILLANNDEVTTTEISIVTLPFSYKLYARNDFEEQKWKADSMVIDLPLKVYQCTLTADDGRSFPVNIIHEDSEKEFEEARQVIANYAKSCYDPYNKKALWKQFYRILENFAWVKYNYAVTAHKSQGSSYDYCISLENDMEQNRDIEERNRIRYVAATRARLKLFIVKG